MAVAEESGEPAWQRLGATLRDALPGISDASEAFRRPNRPRRCWTWFFFRPCRAIGCTIATCCSTRRTSLFLPFFIGRMVEAVFRQGRPWGEIDRIVPGPLPK